jgi:hypothetical protein
MSSAQLVTMVKAITTPMMISTVCKVVGLLPLLLVPVVVEVGGTVGVGGV